LLKFSVVRPFTVGHTIIDKDNYDRSLWITVIGIACLGVALIYFIKFIKMKNYKDYYLLKHD